ncbi:MAG: hypothetical protein DCF15_22180 [Phormidesmis priestleyi]|uniref:J domain-containing protein n=1 Tax=Phormidesmis priestleyi TaxID=268141 RepID=A0A2W4WG65_9CYAN|nr:MAG: hypothetical protein DCF15_22180 [Phormidesmis priestleyi]
MPEPITYYELLGLKPAASVQDIRRAYRDLSKLYHPDTTKLESAVAIPKFQALNEAYATLSSPEKRFTYDLKIGYSRLSVQVGEGSAQGQSQSQSQSRQYSSNAYLDPTDRPLSAGELFALFILGITFLGCLLLVVTISLTKGEMTAVNLTDLPAIAPTVTPTVLEQPLPLPANSPSSNLQSDRAPNAPSFP